MSPQRHHSTGIDVEVWLLTKRGIGNNAAEIYPTVRVDVQVIYTPNRGCPLIRTGLRSGAL